LQISICNGTQYRSMESTPSSDRICLACSLCQPQNKYVRDPCESNADTLCRDCTKCGNGFYSNVTCSEYINTQCTACTTCGSNEYANVTCSGSTNTQCAPCKQCTGNTFASTKCSAISNTECTACRTSCPSTQFISGSCSATHNTPCTGCKSCATNQFVSSACTTSNDTVCTACHPSCASCTNSTTCASCLPSQFLATNGLCVESCNFTGQYAITIGSPRRCDFCDAVCYACTTNLRSFCTECRNPLNTASASDSNTLYLEMNTCVQQCAPSSYKDNSTYRCTALKVCTGLEYESVAPTNSSNRECKAITNCIAGQEIAKDKTATSDRVCIDCMKGSIDDDGSGFTNCKACNAGTYVPEGQTGDCTNYNCTAGTTDDDSQSNTLCVQCGPGHFVPVGSSGLCLVFECPIGMIDDDSDASTPCVECDKSTTLGTYGECVDLVCREEHYYSPNIAHPSTCFPCPAGTVYDTECKCRLCPSGTTSLIGSLECVSCPPGTYDHDTNTASPCITQSLVAVTTTPSIDITTTPSIDITLTKSCFSPKSTVQLENSSIISYSSLFVGAKVLSMNQDGTPYYDTVFRITHYDSTELTLYVRLTTNESVLELTPNHYLYVNECCDINSLALAAHTEVNSTLFTPNGPSVVLKREIVYRKGAYNVHTLNGNIVVDGIVASHFTTESKWNNNKFAIAWYYFLNL